MQSLSAKHFTRRIAGVLAALGLATGGCGGAPSIALPSTPDGGGPPGIFDGGSSGEHDAGVSDHSDAGVLGQADGVPVAIATNQNAPNGLAVDANNVYWTTSDGNVVKAPIAGGGPTVLASGQMFPWGIAVDATTVYWVNAASAGQVMSVPIAGGAPSVLADMQSRPFKLATSNGFLYWTNNGDGTVMKMATSDGQPMKLAAQQGAVAAIVIGGNTLYWSSIGQGAIKALPLGEDGRVVTIASDQDAFTLFVVDTTVYWANIELEDDHGSVFKLDGNAGIPVGLASSPSPLTAVADRLSVYWTDEATRTIRKVPVGGGEATVVATDQRSPSELTIDGTNIYWINATADGAIMKLAK
jgi:hypothetical protein